MDLQQLKREKEREKKRKQREKLRNNQEKLKEAREKDAARKHAEREKFKAEITVHPKKYHKKLEYLKELNVSRVRRHREKNRECKNVSQTKCNGQKQRRRREKRNAVVMENRSAEKVKKEQTRKRVQNYRLRVKLNSPSLPVSTPKLKTSPIIPESAYKHRSSEARAVKRARESIPESPAKKVRIIEKLVAETTPRSKQALSESTTLQSVLNKKTRRKLDTDYEIIDSIALEAAKGRQGRLTATKIVASKLLKKSRKLSAISKALGLNRKTLNKKITNPNMARKTRNDKLTNDDIEKVQEFYLQEASRQMPNKRDVLLLKMETGKKQPVQKHIMEMTQEEAFSEFKKKNPSMKLSKRKFDKLKPEYVRNTKISNRIVCCCTYCENVRLKVQALNRFDKTSPNLTSRVLLEKTLCEQNAPFPPMKCVMRDCNSCGVTLLKGEYADLLREQSNEEIVWKRWEKKKVPLNEDKSVMRVVLATHVTTLANFFEELCESLMPHSQHIMRALWQQKQFRENLDSLKEGEIIMAMDFAENFTCRYGREIQSFHWNQKQISIHPMMLYYIKDGKLQREGFIPVTDDLKHDAYAVSEFEKQAVENLKSKDVDVKVIHQWTDGCAGQYKCRHSFAAISKAEDLYQAKIVRNYFETSHGKGPCDGLGGIVKRKASNAMLQNENLIISSAQELVEFCDNNLVNVGQSSNTSRVKRYECSSRSFKFVETIPRLESTTAKTLQGSRKVHCVSSTGINFQLKTRDLSCYCEGCQQNTQCDNSEYVDKWENRLLRAVDTDTVHSRGNDETSDQLNDAPETNLEDCMHNMDELTVNEFVAVNFNTKTSKVCFFSKVVEVDGNEVCLEYLERRGDFYQYPEQSEQSWQETTDIICRLPKPDIHMVGSRVKCKFSLTNSQESCLKGYRLK